MSWNFPLSHDAAFEASQPGITCFSGAHGRPSIVVGGELEAVSLSLLFPACIGSSPCSASICSMHVSCIVLKVQPRRSGESELSPPTNLTRRCLCLSLMDIGWLHVHKTWKEGEMVARLVWRSDSVVGGTYLDEACDEPSGSVTPLLKPQIWSKIRLSNLQPNHGPTAGV